MNGNQGGSDWSSVEAPHAGHANVFLMVHRLLRGRYILTVVLALVFASVGGAAGYFSQRPQYRSDAVIQIQPVLPKILYETEQSAVPQMFSNIVAAQADLISRPTVVQYALESDRWRTVRDRAEIQTVEQFVSRLQVRNNRATQQLIFVSFSHEDAEVAHAANRAVVDAYMDLHGRRTEQGAEATLGVLKTRLRNRETERNQRTDEIATIVDKWKTNDMNMLVQSAFDEVAGLDRQRQEIEGRLSQLDSFSTRGADGQAVVLTEEQAAELDPEVAEWIGLRRQLQARKLEMIASGILENHRQVRSVEAGISSLNSQIQTRIAMLQSGGTGGLESGRVMRDELRNQLRAVTERLEFARQQQAVLVADNRRLINSTAQLEEINSDIRRTSLRIDQLETESQAADIADVRGRVSVVSEATRPSRPSSDKRVKLGMAGFVVGGGVPVAMMLGLGMIGRRVRFSDDNILESANSRIVGVLPDLGKSLTDRELAEASAFAVHQIRAQLQILQGRDRHAVYSVTSPAPGDGKTSMIIALGLSFAESGSRTLLVDLDLIGRGLSLHFGYPAAPSLADAAARADDLGALIHPTNFERLSILPAGFGDDLRISRLSPDVIARIVGSLRERYDTILIDSGPILGSIEAGLLAPAVDGVMMVVGRNQLRPLVRRAVDQIHAVGGQVIATVFNRASIQELRQSSSSMSVHFSRQASRQAAEQAARGGRVGGTSVGPLGGSLIPTRAPDSVGGPTG